MNFKLFFKVLLVLLLLAKGPVFADGLIISEFMALNSHTLQDEDSDYSDWIEIQNTGTNAVSLKGYFLTDNQDNLDKWEFPDVNLGAGKFLVVFASEKDRTDPAKQLHTNFKLSGSGEFLALVDTDGKAIIFSYAPQFPPQKDDVSYGIFNGQEVFFDQPTPGAANVLGSFVQSPEFSQPRGYYSEPFYVSLENPDPEAKLYYTTDGRRPTPENATLYSQPVLIRTTTPLSAIAVKNNVSSTIISNTYFFTDSILKQPNNPPGYPAEWGDYETIPGTSIADYEMDPEICDDPKYKPLFADAFQSIPTLSIVTDPGNLFSHSTNPDTGGIYIYTNSTGNGIGEDWERPASVEYIETKNNTWFQINCALRIQGGQSRVPEKTPKHSFRLKFKSEYGPSKLDFHLFDDSDATTKFNTLVLRANYGYTWLHMTANERKNAKYVQDSWAKDTQLAMGDPSAHNKFVHLFLNGLYWGLYDISERIDNEFMDSYLKGSAADFDVIKDYTEIVDGNLNAWDAMMTMANKGLQNLALYEKIQGNNPDGTPNQNYPAYVDVENLIDYMLMNFYGGNDDWDHHNWVTARNRVKPGKGFKFFSWDAEHIFANLNYDNTDEFNKNCPSNLFTQLAQNAEFKILLADRIQQLFYGNGLLTPESAADRYMSRANEIKQAILCESARWGDYRRDVHPRDSENDLYTPEYWQNELDWMINTYFPERTDIVINQLRMSGLFPWVDAPMFTQQGGQVSEEFELGMYASDGTIYYTVNGLDPREVGGSIGTNGVYSYQNGVKINGNGTVKARVKSGDTWSALTEATFTFPDSTLVLTGEYGLKDGTGNFPNPFKTTTTIWFNLEKESPVQIRIYNAQGRFLETIFDGTLDSGTQYQTWQPKIPEKGIYLYQIQTNDKTVSGKMIYMN